MCERARRDGGKRDERVVVGVGLMCVSVSGVCVSVINQKVKQRL